MTSVIRRGPFFEIRMREKCATCAFRSGTEANQSALTLIKAKLCRDTGIPFLCHEADRDAMCAGFADLITADYEKGTLANGPEWRRELYVKLLDVIEHYEDADREGKPMPDFAEEMRNVLQEMKKTRA